MLLASDELHAVSQTPRGGLKERLVKEFKLKKIGRDQFLSGNMQGDQELGQYSSLSNLA